MPRVPLARRAPRTVRAIRDGAFIVPVPLVSTRSLRSACGARVAAVYPAVSRAIDPVERDEAPAAAAGAADDHDAFARLDRILLIALLRHRDRRRHFRGPGHDGAVVLFDFDEQERVRVAPEKLSDHAFDHDLLIDEIGGGPGSGARTRSLRRR